MSRRKKPPKRSRQRLQQWKLGDERDIALRTRRRDELLNDRRRYLPKRDDLPRRDDGRRVNFKSYDEYDDEYRQKPSNNITGRTSFVDPKRVTVCQRRETRRKVLFELQKIGKGKSGGNKKRRMSKYSHIVCKRR